MRPDFSPTLYLLASRRNGTLYAGVTSNLFARIHQHREALVRGFTRDYGVKLLV
jgi:putative endonuclease